MRIERTLDKDLVKRFYSIPEIAETASEDGQALDQFEPDVVNDGYLMALDGETLVGMVHIQAHNSITIDAHIQILPEHRKQHSESVGLAFYHWFLKETPFQKLRAEVAEIYPNVQRYLMRFGFQAEGVNRQSYLKNGHTHDCTNYGITRHEIEVFLCQQSQQQP